jgi:hypothetical protein
MEVRGCIALKTTGRELSRPVIYQMAEILYFSRVILLVKTFPPADSL